jgi:hypothetical protein
MYLNLGGCVVNVYPNIPTVGLQTAKQNTEVTVSVAQTPPTDPEVSGPVPTPVLEPPTDTAPEACERFVWTDSGATPPQAGFVADVLTKRDEYTPQKINNLLLEYIFSLRQYVTTSHQDLRTEYLEYLKRCEYPNDKEIPKTPYPPS